MSTAKLFTEHQRNRLHAELDILLAQIDEFNIEAGESTAVDVDIRQTKSTWRFHLQVRCTDGTRSLPPPTMWTVRERIRELREYLHEFGESTNENLIAGCRDARHRIQELQTLAEKQGWKIEA